MGGEAERIEAVVVRGGGRQRRARQSHAVRLAQLAIGQRVGGFFYFHTHARSKTNEKINKNK